MWTNDATCNIMSWVEIGNFDFISKGWAIIWSLLISNSAKPF